MRLPLVRKVYSEQELRSRYEVLLENYCKVKAIEANTMLDMTGKQYQPAILSYSGVVANAAAKKTTRTTVPFGSITARSKAAIFGP